jgi:hypothetical protein
MSQAFKDHIWGQLGLGYTMKQNHDKHKTIWWLTIDPRKVMTQDNFISQQNITYLDLTQEGELAFTQKPHHFYLHMGATSFR